jgi:Tfp pilus assembly pilus retraction ATPase PilT
MRWRSEGVCSSSTKNVSLAVDYHIAADDVFQLIAKVNRDSGTSFLLVTHNLDLARRCDRIHRGRITHYAVSRTTSVLVRNCPLGVTSCNALTDRKISASPSEPDIYAFMSIRPQSDCRH